MARGQLTVRLDAPELEDALSALRSMVSGLHVRLDRIERAITANTVNDIITREALMADFTDLTAEVEANGNAVDSAVTLLDALSAQLTDAADDPAEIRAIADQLNAQSSTLAAAVAANTPAATDTPAEPAPEA